MNRVSKTALTALLAAAVLLAAGNGAAGEGAKEGGGKEVVLRVNAEEFTRDALRHTGPILSEQHERAYLRPYVERFINYRLVLQEARRLGIEEGEVFLGRLKMYDDTRAADALIWEVLPDPPEVSEAEVDEYSRLTGVDSEAARTAVAEGKIKDRLEQYLSTCGVEVPVSKAGNIPAMLEGEVDPKAVVAAAGEEKITCADLQRALGAGGADPEEIDRALESLLLLRRLVVVARAKGYGGKADDQVLREAFREKLLEAVFLEEVEAAQEVTDEEVRRALEESGGGGDPEEVRRQLLKRKVREAVHGMLEKRRAESDIWIADGLVRDE